MPGSPQTSGRSEAPPPPRRPLRSTRTAGARPLEGAQPSPEAWLDQERRTAVLQPSGSRIAASSCSKVRAWPCSSPPPVISDLRHVLCLLPLLQLRLSRTKRGRDKPRALETAAGKGAPLPRVSEHSSVVQRSDYFPESCLCSSRHVRTGPARFSWSGDRTQVKCLAGKHAEQESEHQTCSRCDLPRAFARRNSSGDRESCPPRTFWPVAPPKTVLLPPNPLRLLALPVASPTPRSLPRPSRSQTSGHPLGFSSSPSAGACHWPPPGDATEPRHSPGHVKWSKVQLESVRLLWRAGVLSLRSL